MTGRLTSHLMTTTTSRRLRYVQRKQEEDLDKVFDMFGKGDGKIQFKDFRRVVKELRD